MRHVPVIATVRDAYLFTVRNLGAIIGLIWIPMVLLTVMGFFSFQRYYNELIDAMSGGDPNALGPALLMMLGYLVAALLLQAMMYVAVVQLALGARAAPAVAHFAFGPAEWRMFRAFGALVGVVLVLAIPALVLGSLLVQLAAPGAPPEAASGLLFLIVYGVLLVAAPRFFTLLPAVAVAEPHPVLRRSWTLSAGNFWRLLGVLVLSFGPLFVLFSALEMTLTSHAPVPPPGTSQMIASMIRARDVLPLISGVGFLISPIVVGLFAGVSVSAWRTLKDEPSVELVA